MMKKKYVMPTVAQQTINLSNCLMAGSGNDLPGGGTGGATGGLSPMGGAPARVGRVYV